MPNAHFTPTPGGPTYRIIKNADVDGAYEGVGLKKSRPLKRPAPATPESSKFAGTDRKVAKLSVATGKTETFSDISKLIATLPDVMAALMIPLGPTSGRVSQEQRNISVTGFLYAATREPDNDFYLVVGRAPNVRKKCIC